MGDGLEPDIEEGAPVVDPFAGGGRIDERIVGEEKREGVGGSGLESGKKEGLRPRGARAARLPRGFAARNDVERTARVQANKLRKVQVARGGGRKLFGKAARRVFLEWFAATCNIKWSAEMAGFNYKTVLRRLRGTP